MGRKQGLTEEKLAALQDYEASQAFGPLEKAALRYADGMTSTPVDVPQELFDRLAALLSEQQLVELTSSIAWENYRARFDHAFEIESEGFSAGQFCPLPVRGG